MTLCDEVLELLNSAKLKSKVVRGDTVAFDIPLVLKANTKLSKASLRGGDEGTVTGVASNGVTVTVFQGPKNVFVPNLAIKGIV